MHVNTVHLKQKPFKCGYCNQVFGRKDTAKRHEKQWCSIRPFKEGNTISGPEMDIVSGPEMDVSSESKPEMGSESKPVLVSQPDVVSGQEQDVISGPEMEVGSELEPFEQKPEVETNFSNPWNVSDLSLFLRYCCPECDYKCEEAHLFCEHALDFHKKSNVLLENWRDEKSQTNVKQEISDDYDESFEVVQDFDDFDNEYSLNEEPKGQLISE